MAPGNIGIYVFKVALVDNKKIWRTIAIQGRQTLDDLHYAVFHAFDRDDEHLYSFYFPRSKPFNRRRLADCVEYTSPYGYDEIAGSKPTEVYDASKTRINTLRPKEGQKFMYLFDFGDMWWHEITVEKTNEPAADEIYPKIIRKEGTSPEQYPHYEE